MIICACGCGKEIPYAKWHDTHPPKFIKGHNTERGTHIWARYSKRRLPPEGVPCACGCGGMVTEYKNSRQPRYPREGDKLYLPKHRPHGANHHLWKGGRRINNYGYVTIYSPDHPQANKDGYVLEHRYIWEQANNRLLTPSEHIHHINGDRSDNRIENLIMLTQSQHSKLTRKELGNIPNAHESCSRAGKMGAKARWG